MNKILSLLALCMLATMSFGQTTILDHEAPATTTTFSYFGNCFLDGAPTGVVANPDASGDNTSANVGMFVKTDCALTFAGCFGNPAPSVPVDLTSDNTIRIKLWAQNTGTFEVKLEGSTTGGDNWLGSVNVTTAGQWVTYELDATAASLEAPFTAAAGNSYGQVVFFANLGVAGTGTNDTTYFDDLETILLAQQIDLPVSFDDAGVDYTVTDFGDNMSVLGVDPTDGSNNVMCTTKPVSAQLWAGTTIGTPAGFANAIPIDASNTIMTMRIYSPDAGIPVRMKIEDSADPTKSVESEVLTTTSGAWETLTWDFTMEAPGTAPLNLSYTFDKASVFFNFGTDGATAGEKLYYWDDVEFPFTPGMSQIDLPISFDDPAVDYTVIDFGGNATVDGADPVDAANNVKCTTKPVGAQLWAGTTIGNPNFASAIPFSADNTTMSIRIYSPDAGTPIRLKVEDSTDPTISVETETMTTVANAWETLIFDFSMEVAGTSALNLANTYDMASVFFNFGTDGATAGEKLYYWDDVEFYIVPLAQIDLPITFDDAGVDYTVTDFGGNGSVLAPDPVDASNTVVCTTKPDFAELWAGVTASTPAGLASQIPFTATNTSLTVRVYSPDAGIPVLLKVENSANGAISAETSVMTTMANAWETMTFDLSNTVPGTPAYDASAVYDKVSIFFNFGTPGAVAGEKTYYWDDVMMAPEVVCDNSTAPTGLTATVMAGGVQLTWDAVQGSIGCQLQGTDVTAGVGPKTANLHGLERDNKFLPNSQLNAGSTYEVRVRCTCGNPPVANATPLSAPVTFSVPVLRSAEVVSNNPVSQIAYLTIESMNVQTSAVQLLDLNGRVMGEWSFDLFEGENRVQLDLSNFANGHYLINVAGTDFSNAQQVIVQH